jgi:hypothetical protein
MEEQVDLEGNAEGYSGTFRWKKTKKLLSMPDFISASRASFEMDTKGWITFFKSRVSPTFMQTVQQDLSVVDMVHPLALLTYLSHILIIL